MTMQQLLWCLVFFVDVNLVVSYRTAEDDYTKFLAPQYYNIPESVLDFLLRGTNPSTLTDEKSTEISKLYDALNAKKPDEDEIIRILAPTNMYERDEIKTIYQNTYGVSLVNDLKDKLTGKFEETLVALITTPRFYFAQELSSSLRGIRADEKALIDILCIFNNTFVDKIRNAYLQYYGQTLDHVLNVNTITNFKKLIFACIRNVRSEKTYSSDLFKDIYEDKLNHDALIDLMATNSFSQILKFAMDYYKYTGNFFERAVQDTFFGDFQRALIQILNYAKSEKVFFAKRLFESLQYKIVDHRSLIRLAIMDKKVRHSEIHEFYEKLFRQNLDEVIRRKIPSGSYRKLIQALLSK